MGLLLQQSLHVRHLRLQSRSYSLEALECVATDVATGALSLRKAAKTNGVPTSTLHDRKTGKVSSGSKWGKGTLLYASQELEMVQIAFKRAEIGKGFSKQNFLRYIHAHVSFYILSLVLTYLFLQHLIES